MTLEKTENTINVEEAILIFYKKKREYETKRHEAVREIFSNPAATSFKRKKQEFAKFVPKCINCGADGGSEFLVRSDGDDANAVMNHRIFTAKCGNIDNPCNFHIHIKYGNRILYATEIQTQMLLIAKQERAIIMEKNNNVFFKREITKKRSIEHFTSLTAELKEQSQYTGGVIKLDISRNHNTERHQKLREAETEFGEMVRDAKLRMKTYMQASEQERTELMQNHIDIYKTTLKPKAAEIRALKYDESQVQRITVLRDTDDTTPSCPQYVLLTQTPNSIESRQYYFSEEDEIRHE